MCNFLRVNIVKGKSYLITSTIIRYEIVKTATDGNDEEGREAQEHKCDQSRAKDKSDNHVSCQQALHSQEHCYLGHEHGDDEECLTGKK